MKTSLAKQFNKVGPGGLVLRVGLVWFVLAFLIFPNINMLVSMFIKDGEFSTEVIRKLFSSVRARKALMNSLILAVSMLVTVNVVGIALVLITEYFDIKGAKILKLAYLSTLVYSGIVLCTGYKFIYGANGIVTNLLLRVFPNLDPNWFTGYFAVIFIMTFACTSNHIIFLTNAIRGIDYQTVEAAKNMGATPGKIFLQIVLPVLKPTLFAVTVLTFLTGLSAMSAPLVVGGPDFQTINPIIITFAKTQSSRDIASLLSVLLGMATIVILAVTNRIEKRGHYMSVSKVKSRLVKQKINNPVMNVLAHAGAYILFLIYAGPILLVILYSFSDYSSITSGNLSFSSLSLENYKRLFTSAKAFKPYVISISYSAAAAVMVALLTFLAARIIQKSRSVFSTGLEYSMLIPWLLPNTLIALGLMTTYDVPRMILFNKVLIGTTSILLIAYVIIRIPFALRIIKASLYSIDSALEEASRNMGASSFYTSRRIIIPTILPALLSVIALTFNHLLADYDLTVFLYHPLLTPLGPTIKAASDEDASLEAKAMTFVYAVVIMIISSAALYLVYGRNKKEPKRRA